jgi:hypothetical protein
MFFDLRWLGTLATSFTSVSFRPARVRMASTRPTSPSPSYRASTSAEKTTPRRPWSKSRYHFTIIWQNRKKTKHFPCLRIKLCCISTIDAHGLKIQGRGYLMFCWQNP